MMLIGIIWALTAPLLLLPVCLLLGRLLAFTGWPRRRRLAVAGGGILLIVGALWWTDYREYADLCRQVGTPQIFARARADGIYLDSPTANSFGMNYLHQQGFAWLEMRSIYDRTRFERVIREADGKLRTEPADAVTARYEVREAFEKPSPYTSVMATRVIDRQTGSLLARAGRVHFDGGRARWVLGVYGARDYPGALQGDEFKTFSYLAQRTLRQ